MRGRNVVHIILSIQCAMLETLTSDINCPEVSSLYIAALLLLLWERCESQPRLWNSWQT